MNEINKENSKMTMMGEIIGTEKERNKSPKTRILSGFPNFYVLILPLHIYVVKLKPVKNTE
jgi:hypothetical protein